MENELFVVTMYRWGERENHSYVLGVFDDKEKTESAGTNEMSERPLYDMEIIRFKLNDITHPEKIIKIWEESNRVYVRKEGLLDE